VLRVEKLEDRALLTTTPYTYPYGAMPDDTGEYMLGDVAVNVVLMESDPTMAPYDNNAANDPVHPGHGFPVEDWTADAIANVKQNIQDGLQWWKDTLANVFPKAPSDLLDFQINWQYANSPVHTGYEPIARKSNDFAQDSYNPFGTSQGWIYDFLNQAGFGQTGNFSTDIRAFNDYTRQQANADWAFTIFVVNNANDPDKLFDLSGSFSQAFSFAGGRFEIVPASRPASTYSHETGHQFWALDQYLGGGSYVSQRGYYNTQNLNAADNPAPGFVQADTIMSNGSKLANAVANHISDPYTLAQIGWQDSDNNGIFDVLDVPFTLSGSGQYNPATGLYSFTGSTNVNTLPNRNASGLQNDITINQIRAIQYKVDDGAWQTAQMSIPPRTYQTSVSVSFAVPTTGSHTVQIRSIDTRTGVTSNVFSGETDGPTAGGPLTTGVVFRDDNGNGKWDNGEPSLPNNVLLIDDQFDAPLNLKHTVEPEDWPQNTVLNGVEPGVMLSAIGSGAGSSDVYASTSTIAPAAGKVFSALDSFGTIQPTWNGSRQLRANFTAPVSTVSLQAYSGTPGSSPTYARLEAYNKNNQLVARYTTTALSTTTYQTLTISRTQGDIDHVIAYGHLGTSVTLDTLQWGPAATATTNTNGAYSLAFLPDGTYHVQLEVPAGHVLTIPASGTAVITVSGGQMTGATNFGVAVDNALPPRPFYNVNNPKNVDNDAGNNVAPIDALMVINYINAHPGTNGAIDPGANPAIVGYIDVNGDGLCTPGDALIVINTINSRTVAMAGAGGEAPPVAAVSAPTSSAGAGEGERQVSVPQSADQYFAQNPIHFGAITGTDQPCSCAQCVAGRTATDAVISSLPAAVSRLPGEAVPFLSPAGLVSRRRGPGSPEKLGEGALENTLDCLAVDVSQAAGDDSGE
jgi:hypothetical protein